jgi:4-amino-4-deoxy-L-arabinose transferase-like glycosyltransferase
MTGILENRRNPLIVAAFALALLCLTNLPWQLDDYDQAKQAYTSFEMVKEGHWLYQHTPHERIATKPPLVGWISSGIFEITRSWDIAWRLPSLGAAIALSILLFRAGKVYGATSGLIAISAFAFNLLTPRLATLVRTDMPLALVIFAIGYLIWNKIRTRELWSPRGRWCLFALLTAAMLIKGPIVYAFLLPGIIGFEVRRCCSRGALSPRLAPANTMETPRQSEAATTPARSSAWSGWWPWIFSVAIFLVWAICGSLFVPGFYDQVVGREFLGRFGETIHRPQPFLFYLPHLLHKFFPWSVLMIGLTVADLRTRGWKIRETFRTMSPETLWLVLWIFCGLLVMSIIPSKRVDRIFPIVPPLCLLLATQVGSVLPNEKRSRRVLQWTAVTLVLSIFWTSGYAILRVVSGYREHRNALVQFGREVRREAEVHRWRYEVVKSNDEGLLLYLEKMHFIEPEFGLAQWNTGNVDALVAPDTAPWRDILGPNDRYLITPQSQQRRSGASYILIFRGK